jgi:VanZ family protein
MTQRRWAIAAAGIALAIFVLSSIPAEDLARTGIRIWDKAAHAAVWAVLTFCVGRALGARRHAVLIAIAIGVGYGAVDEIHQGFTPGRDPSGWDIVADGVGAVAGALAAAVRRRRDLRGTADPGARLV